MIDDLFFKGLQSKWAGFFGCTFSHKLSSSLCDGPLLQFDIDQGIFSPKKSFTCFTVHITCLFSLFGFYNLLSQVLKFWINTLTLSSLVSLMTRRNCSCLRSRLSLQRMSREGRRRRTTSETSTDIIATTSGNKWCSTMKDTSSWFWGNPSRINPVDLSEKLSNILPKHYKCLYFII